MLLNNKIALITGAASGIGEATARLFVDEGAQVVLADIDSTRLASLSEQLGDAAISLPGDIAREEHIEALMSLVLRQHGRLDCAVNNAGITGAPTTIDAMSLEQFQRTVAINLTGVFLCLKHELKIMRSQGSGAIVNMASGAGVIAVPYMADYCATKHGVLGLTKTAASEVVREGIRVNAILPGSIHTPALQKNLDLGDDMEKLIRGSVPCGRFGSAREVAENCVWLCSDRASYVSGMSMPVDNATVCR